MTLSAMRYSRTRAGCLTCRARRKKCDETKPRCAGCRRNQLPCNWPPSVPSEARDQRHDGPSAVPVRGGRADTSISSASRQVARADAPTAVTQYRPPASTNSIPSTVSAIHIGADSDTQRACILTPQSVSLLSHFLMHTASYFAMGPMRDNPFIAVLLPMAYTDNLLMHALLALSGAHMTSKESTSIEFVRATGMHYAKLIRGLRSEFLLLEDDDLGKREGLLLLLMVACHYEAVSGNPHGALFNHLNASRHLATSLVTCGEKTVSWTQHTGVNSSTLGFSLEMYTYLMLCNGLVTPHTARYSTHVDDFIMPQEEMASFPTFGVLFAGSHDLYWLIPEIKELASRRLDEEADGTDEPSAALTLTYDHINARLAKWEAPPPSWPGERDWEEKCYASEALRHALHVYLFTALAGSVTPQATRSRLVPNLLKCFWYVRQLVASEQHYVATLLWPVVIGASCIVKPSDQEVTIRQFREDWAGMRHMSILAEVLQLMWDDPDPRAYGPYGFRWIMEKHGVVVGIL